MPIVDTDMTERLHQALQSLGVPEADRCSEPLAHYLALLDKWNKAFNLTAVRDPFEMITRHILDSLTARGFLHGISVLDVGTGAGLPGLPLAVTEPLRQFSLLDSGGKKIRFVRHAAGELALANVTVVQSRVESYAPVEPFDTVICRAFTSLREFVDRCGALAARGGRLLAMKGRLDNAELAGIPPGWAATAIEAVSVPGLIGDRHIIVLERNLSGGLGQG